MDIDRFGWHAADREMPALPPPGEEPPMTRLAQNTVKNRILSLLPSDEFARLAIALSFEHLTFGQTLCRAGDKIENVYFVETGCISSISILSEGQPLEVAFVGSEGVANVSVVLGATHAYNELVCHAAGFAYRIDTSAFAHVAAHSPRLRDLLLRYVHVLTVQVAQTAACNAHHDLGQRLARWLLSAHDRSGVEELPLTHDQIALMLGVQRSTVSIAAGILQRAGAIRYHHGRIGIIDRVRLENAACECYEAVANEYRSLFGEHPFGPAPPLE
jgi:CRP-like cAMP-binding protein